MFNHKKNNAMSVSAHTANINTLIGEGCQIKGDMSAKNSIKIEGHIQGNLSIDGSVIIGEKGVVQGDVRCADLIVFGRLEGNINAHQLQLKQTAQTQGNIEVQTLQIDPGAVYQGTILMKVHAGSSTNPSKTPQDNETA